MEKLLDKKEMAKMLGISEGKLDLMIKNEEIHYLRLNKLIRFEPSLVLKSLVENPAFNRPTKINKTIQNGTKQLLNSYNLDNNE
jgi:5'(3')-deoxyribonucleotidase